MARGQLRVYLGAAPGVGKTYRMLEEGHRRRGRGTDVVVGLAEPHGRPITAALLTNLEIVPRTTFNYRGSAFSELDVPAVLARAPEVALVDELAHTNVPGSKNDKRWQDIEELLAAGITVLTTVNIQHLESLNDVVAQITGVPQRETVPDEVVRQAEQIELVDMTPEALRRRMAHGNVYQADKVDAALEITFGSATSPHCGSWLCSGWRTGSTSDSNAIARTTGSKPPGRHGSGLSSRSPAASKAPHSYGVRPGPRPARKAPT